MQSYKNSLFSASAAASATAWNRASVALVGHRGLGMNRTVVKNGQPRLQLGENTLISLIKGGELGAHYVEFGFDIFNVDVQLTKDLVPILYHDFVTSEWENEIPVSLVHSSKFAAQKSKLKRATSQQSIMQPSFDVLKPNGSRTIQCPFATLAEALETVPIGCGFNIEIKYPNLQEAEEYNLHNSEINLFCDKILDVIADHGKDRDILFSSFHPEICFLMNFKQNQFPVFFLTDGGTCKYYDSRLNSLKNAVKFAKDSGCHGIVTNCRPLADSLQMIPYIKDKGLRVYSYGGENNSPPFATSQIQAGIDGVIVDDVKEIKYAIELIQGA
jgi:glycerophosphodiester phosphodiesterase